MDTTTVPSSACLLLPVVAEPTFSCIPRKLPVLCLIDVMVISKHGGYAKLGDACQVSMAQYFPFDQDLLPKQHSSEGWHNVAIVMLHA
mmetsp:Transcript_7779/g.14545  ORF Transcript_7779/g.14545 Transcript_7779/m.14545 type:complete len:88 (+) Transcript_7779:1353-1616(+)